MKWFDACPMCGHSIAVLREEVAVWECGNCGLWFRNPIPDRSSELDDIYIQAWESPGSRPDESGLTDVQLARRYVSKLGEELRTRSFEGMRILDFGAGSGAMSVALTERGAEVHSVDPFSVDILRAAGLRAYADIGDIPPSLSFDGAVALEVVEHLTRPWDQLLELARSLSDDGWFYLSTPNARGLNARLTRSRWREIRKQGHLYFFHAKSMEYLLRSIGLNPRRLSWFIDYGGAAKRFVHGFLVGARLDGALRYLAFKNESPQGAARS